MVAFLRRGAAVLAVVLAILAPAILFYAPLRPVALWHESVFGTLTELLSPVHPGADRNPRSAGRNR